MTEKTLDYDVLDISAADLYEQMGYHGAEPDEVTQREVQAVVDDVRPWLRPRFCYQVVRQLPDFDMGRIIMRQLRGSEAYALFVCTSGMEYETYLQQLKVQGDMVRIYIADALGSVIAEHCADQMERHLQESVDKLGWHHTNRFSPGYCGWHVSQQQRLFAALKGGEVACGPQAGGTPSEDTGERNHPQEKEERNHPCGVRLNDSSLMIPIKSVSGIIGLGHDVRRQDYTCGLCDMKQCYKRRAR